MKESLTLRKRLGLEINRKLTDNLIKEHPLRQLFWECTLRCNLHCRHCGSDCKKIAGYQAGQCSRTHRPAQGIRHPDRRRTAGARRFGRMRTNHLRKRIPLGHGDKRIVPYSRTVGKPHPCRYALGYRQSGRIQGRAQLEKASTVPSKPSVCWQPYPASCSM